MGMGAAKLFREMRWGGEGSEIPVTSKMMNL
jgi:hypothetical protein